jgi:hypothetical protein
VIVAVAGCPNPPLLLPGITGRPVAEVEELRAACLAAVGELLAAAPSRVVVVGGAGPGEHDKPLSVKSGKPLSIESGKPLSVESGKPLSIVIGRQLLREAGCRLPVEHLSVAADAATADCLRAGRELTGRPDATLGLLVMGDGSACRSLKAPGYLDPRAEPFDESVRSCLASGRLAGLAELDAELAAELLVAGRAAWQVLAGAVGESRGQSRLHYSNDPFGVWYPVFSWLPSS